MKSIGYFAVLFMSGIAVADPQLIDIPALQGEAKVLIKNLATSLSGELQKAIAQGGPADGIQVCNLKALPLTAATTEGSEWQIGRTSLKLRNPENAPDNWEVAVLEDFQAKAEAGADLQTLAYSEVLVGEDGSRTFRMMKAIPVADKCLACHGAELSNEVTAVLDGLYPEDEARGFAQGDLRGAFTLQKTF
ncbi:DUF3365 domain-containing protein [Neptuniibacter sp. CAU 1671]|uniref:Tll0287-like domain-containing protein n=1 Tax=Neptuniibacter sp. CAU 1671 TaxID=3032593 RepID=UPI0023DB0820|nr:DUF3365 domain-containing protein [Neptuniibacter sp. CAU 1671]MDF2181829.1 DUF3365 domain-containing protein [Neptuniibacter sp. CAU 1671]